MEERNEKAQELDLEQMEKVSGGAKVKFAYVCPICNELFSDYGKFIEHRTDCGVPKDPPNPTSFPIN